MSAVLSVSPLSLKSIKSKGLVDMLFLLGLARLHQRDHVCPDWMDWGYFGWCFGAGLSVSAPLLIDYLRDFMGVAAIIRLTPGYNSYHPL